VAALGIVDWLIGAILAHSDAKEIKLTYTPSWQLFVG
jgi:hypothetical protein